MWKKENRDISYSCDDFDNNLKETNVKYMVVWKILNIQRKFKIFLHLIYFSFNKRFIIECKCCNFIVNNVLSNECSIILNLNETIEILSMSSFFSSPFCIVLPRTILLYSTCYPLKHYPCKTKVGENRH